MPRPRQTALGLALLFSIAVAIAAAALVFGGYLPPFMRAPITDADYGPPRLALAPVAFSDLPGWRRDNQAEAIPVFVRSCDRIDLLDDEAPANGAEALGEGLEEISLSGRAIDWREACIAARAFSDTRYADATAAASAARAFFEFHFRPLKIISVRSPLPDSRAEGMGDRISETGLFTGYFEPSYDASTFRTDTYSAPVLRRPPDLIMADLGEFRKDLAGERIAGYLENGTLKPYPGRSAINAGALDDRAEPIAWLRPNDLFFLQIQGSGRLRLQNGRIIRVGYDGQNGRPYTAIGRVLVERGVMNLDDVTMQSIRAWLDGASEREARALRETNESYVFFRELERLSDPELGPLGAQDVQLTPARSVAVDRRYHALGAPVWLEIPSVEGRTPEIDRLFIAQDTGGAIKGPMRVDIFLGAGERAGEAAGRLRAEGEMVVLAPRNVAVRLDAAGVLDRR